MYHARLLLQRDYADACTAQDRTGRSRKRRSMDCASLLYHLNHTHMQHNGQATLGQDVPSLAIACDRHLWACVTGGGLLVVHLSGHELPAV